jgi:hypothetical protein
MGIQTVNLGLNCSGISNEEWSVIVSDSVFLPMGQGWNLLPDGSVQVWGETGNVTVLHFASKLKIRVCLSLCNTLLE